jgi:CyaY protein
MDEATYQALADEAMARIEDAFKDVDPDEVDCERAGDVLTLTFADGKRCVVNTQRPTRQLWLAANARAWHFSYDPTGKRWVDDKGGTVELFQQIRTVTKDLAGLDLVLS